MSAQPTEEWVDLIAEALLGGPAIIVNGSTTTAGTSVTSLGNALGVTIGDIVTGLDVVTTPPTTVVAVDNVGHTATLSQAVVTGHAATPLTFTPAPPLSLKVGLFMGEPSLTVETLYADLAQPTYPGYATQTPVLGAVRGNAAGDVIVPLGTTTWQPTGAVSPEQVITGFFVALAGPNLLLFAEMLPSPKAFTGPLDALDINDEVYFPAEAVYGGICTVCGL